MTATSCRRTRSAQGRSPGRWQGRQGRKYDSVSSTAPLFYPPNRLVEPPLDVVEPVPVPAAPKRDEIPLALPPLPESLSELAVTVPLLALIPLTTTESPGCTEFEPTETDLVIFDSGVVSTSTIVPAVVVTNSLRPSMLVTVPIVARDPAPPPRRLLKRPPNAPVAPRAPAPRGVLAAAPTTVAVVCCCFSTSTPPTKPQAANRTSINRTVS